MNSPNKTTKKTENYIIELLKLLYPYKWSIFAITLLTILLAKLYLYFIPSTYESYAIIKVKVNTQAPTEDVLRDSLNKTNTVGIKQEMAILKTYKTNKEALDKVNFKVKYFEKVNYRKNEFYKNSPISIENISHVSLAYMNYELMLTPKENGFTLSSKERGESQLYTFNEEHETPYFTGIVVKNKNFNEKIYFSINGTRRQIYEGIIKSSLEISQVDKNANLVKVAFQDTVPDRANDYVDALIKTYIKQSIEKKEQTNSKILNFLDSQLEAVRIKLEKSETQLEQYKSANSVDPSVKSKDAFERLSTIDLDLSELVLKEKLIKNLTRFVQNNKNLSAIGPTLLEFNDQSTLKLLDDLQTLQQKEDELKIEYTDKYPKLITLRKQIRNTRKKILLNVKNLKSTIVSKRANLESQKSKYEITLKELPKKEKKLVSFQRDYQVNSKMYTYLLEKKSENELIKVASVSDYEAIDAAYTPSYPIKPKRMIFLIIATILGLIFAIILSLLRALFVDKVTTTKDIKLLTELPIYGVIPILKNSMLGSELLKESYQKLAANVQFSKKDNEGNVVLVSSHSEGEGKTTIIASLAGVFQQTQYKSVLVDFNLSKPSLHSYFGLEHQYTGVSTFLNNRDNLGNIIFSTKYPNLDIITAGPISPNPTELILSPRLKELFKLLKERYDYILIDTSSYKESLDALYLMQYADTNLIILTEGSSKKSTIHHLEKTILEKNLSNIGLVIRSPLKNEKKISKNLLANQKPKALNNIKKEPIQLSL